MSGKLEIYIQGKKHVILNLKDIGIRIYMRGGWDDAGGLQEQHLQLKQKSTYEYQCKHLLIWKQKDLGA